MRWRWLCPCMGVLVFAVVCLGVIVTGQDRFAGHIAPTPPLSPDEESARFQLPDGVSVTLFASEPVIGKPMNLAFDSKGRLWVTQSFEYPFPARDPEHARDRLSVLEDTDGDGRADRYTVFADHLNIPIGVLPVPGGAVAYSIPNIWLFEDRDGDGRSDRRTPLIGPFGYADTHGMVNSFTWGFDGRIYACHGFANQSNPVARDGTTLNLHSGNTFRFRADGTALEQFTWGQVNPFGLVFDEWGNLYSADCHSYPITLLMRLAYYPSFGKPHDGLGFCPPICPHDHGSTAIAGIAFLEGEHWPEQLRGFVLTGNVVTNRINADRLRWNGSTPVAAHQADFLISEDPWFRPVDMELGPDGALYVADFYNRIIGHYEVPLDHPGRDRFRGRIWRIAPSGKAKAPEPLPAYADTDTLIGYLAHTNPTVRMLSANELVWRVGKAATEKLRGVVRDTTQAPLRRAMALWVLRRLEAVDEETLESVASCPEELVRVHTMQIVGDLEEPDARLLALLRRGTSDPSPRVRRAAVTALGQHPHPDNVPYLVHVLRTCPTSDPLLKHATRIALREHLYLDAVVEHWRTEPAGSLALAFLDVAQGAHSPTVASAYLSSLEQIQGVHLDPPAAEYFARYLPPQESERFAALVARELQESEHAAAQLLAAIARGLKVAGRKPPAALQQLAHNWLKEELRSGDSERQLRALEVAEGFGISVDGHLLRTLATSPRASQELKARCLRLAASERVRELLDVALAALDTPLKEPSVALAAVEYVLVLGDKEGEERLRNLLRTLPAQAATLLAARLAQHRRGAELVLEEAEAGNVPLSVLATPAVQAALANSGAPDAQSRVQKLVSNMPPLDPQVARLIEELQGAMDQVRSADAARGKQLFAQHCSPCHRAGMEGGDVGPQLDGIGTRGLARLVEDVLDPNRNVDQAFWRTLVVLSDGRVLSGLARTDEASGNVILIDEQAKETVIQRSEIEAMRRVRVSPMPSNFGQILSREQLYHLFAYLLSLKAPVEEAKVKQGQPSTSGQ